MTAKQPPESLSFEQARDELLQIVTALEAGSATLDDSMALWERGEALARRCEALLDGAEQAISKAAGDAND